MPIRYEYLFYLYLPPIYFELRHDFDMHRYRHNTSYTQH